MLAKKPVHKRPVAAVYHPPESHPELDTLVREIIGRVADKWTMLVLGALEESGRLRFTRLREVIGEVSLKMLTQTLRQMESDGLVSRTIYPVVPPRVEYELTDLGHGLGEAFCGVWIWAEKHRDAIVAARNAFQSRSELVNESMTESPNSKAKSTRVVA